MIPGITPARLSKRTPTELEKSYEWCTRGAKAEAKNFYYSFLLLPLAQRNAMCAMYAFMRYCDDLSDGDVDDEDVDRSFAIAAWKRDLDLALAGKPRDHPLWPAFVHTVKKYRIPHYYFFEMIEGVSSDLEPRRVQTFQELYDYCYHVASVVGLTIVHIFGFDEAESTKVLALAEKCGIAFQLTNILRDVREDAEKGRVYLPAEDLKRFNVQAPKFTYDESFRTLMDYQAKRAQQYYRDSAPLIEMIDPESRASLKALIGIYSRLLDKIVAAKYDVLSQRVRVPTWEKLWILAKSRRGSKSRPS
jgi:15-cis-phytoene synthase